MSISSRRNVCINYFRTYEDATPCNGETIGLIRSVIMFTDLSLYTTSPLIRSTCTFLWIPRNTQTSRARARLIHFVSDPSQSQATTLHSVRSRIRGISVIHVSSIIAILVVQRYRIKFVTLDIFIRRSKYF